MLSRKGFFILLTFFILVGCATNPNITVMRPDGGPVPDPYYVLQTIGMERPLRLSFYYAAVQKVEDLDGSKQPTVSYLERRTEYHFSKDNYPDLHAVLRVLNPTNLPYKVNYRMHVDFSNGGRMDAYSELAYSDMKYREIACPMPLGDGKGAKVSYEVELTDVKGNVLLRTGQFKYKFN